MDSFPTFTFYHFLHYFLSSYYVPDIILAVNRNDRSCSQVSRLSFLFLLLSSYHFSLFKFGNLRTLQTGLILFYFTLIGTLG